MPWIPLNYWKKKGPALKKKKKAKARAPRYKLMGYDTFSAEWYNLGSYPSETAAQNAAQEKLKENELHQPSSSSGGQSGIQDQVHIQQPDGTRYRVYPNV
jgi:hypothetical protein